MKKFIIAVVAIAAVAGCSRDNDQPAGENVTQAIRDPNLQTKTFWGACTTEPSTAIATGILTGHAIKASRTAFNFDGAQAIRMTRFYERADCSGDSAFTFRELAGFNIHQDKKTSDGAAFIDFNYDRLMVHIDSETGKTVANGINLCQASNWTVKEDRNVTTAASAITCYTQTLPRTELNVYRVEGSSLFLGSESRRSADGRPSTLDRQGQQYVAE